MHHICTPAQHLLALPQPPISCAHEAIVAACIDLGCLLSGIKQVSSLYFSQIEFFSP